MNTTTWRASALPVALSILLPLAGCGWVERQKESAARRAREGAFIDAVRAGDLAAIRSSLASDPGLANAVERAQRRKGRLDEVGTALTVAAGTGRVEAVETLLAAGADPNGSGRDRRATPLHAVTGLKVDDGTELRIAKLLLDRGARIDARDDGGWTPIHALLNRGGPEEPRLPLLRLLAERPGGTEVRDGDGRAPLHFAAEFRLPLLLEALLSSGADPNARVTAMERLVGAAAIDGDTPLHFAVRSSDGSGRVSGVFVLCAAGADAGVRNGAGKTPADVARDLLARAKGSGASPGSLRAAESLVAALAPGGPCERLLARFRAEGRPASWAGARFEEGQHNCAAGDATGCEAAGRALDEGTGVAADPARALEAFAKACDAGGVWGCAMAGSLRRSGRGAPEDAAEAARFFGRACDGGHAWSCNELGEMVRDGTGVARDTKRALDLFATACRGGLAKACENGRELEARSR